MISHPSVTGGAGLEGQSYRPWCGV